MPQVAAGFEDGVSPAGVVGLEPVVAAAERSDVVTRCRSALGVGDHVVVVAGLGGAGAPREHTGQVTFGGLVGEPVGDLVLVDMDLLGQVDHRLHDHRGAGDATPGADLVGVHER